MLFFSFLLQRRGGLQRQRIVIESNRVLRDDLDTRVHQKERGSAAACYWILESLMTFQPPRTEPRRPLY